MVLGDVRFLFAKELVVEDAVRGSTRTFNNLTRSSWMVWVEVGMEMGKGNVSVEGAAGGGCDEAAVL